MRFNDLYDYTASNCTSITQPECIAYTEKAWIERHIDNLEEIGYSVLEGTETAEFFKELFPEDTMDHLRESISEVLGYCMYLREDGDPDNINDYDIAPCVLVRDYKLNGNPLRGHEIIGVCDVGVQALGVLVALFIRWQKEQEVNQSSIGSVEKSFDEVAQEILDRLDKLPLKELTEGFSKLESKFDNVLKDTPVLEVATPMEPEIVESHDEVIKESVETANKAKYKSRLRLFKNR